jgi:hypothetical protein
MQRDIQLKDVICDVVTGGWSQKTLVVRVSRPGVLNKELDGDT